MYENYHPLWMPEEDLVLRPGRSVTIPLGAMPADACRLFLTGETASVPAGPTANTVTFDTCSIPASRFFQRRDYPGRRQTVL